MDARVTSAYDNLPDPEESNVDLMELYHDEYLQVVHRHLSSGGPHLSELSPPPVLDEDEIEDAMPGDYEQFLEGGPVSMDVERESEGDQPHPWFESGEPASKQGCLAIAKAMEDELGIGEWGTTSEIADLDGHDYAIDSARPYLNSLAKAPFMEKESGSPAKYKLISSWRAE